MPRFIHSLTVSQYRNTLRDLLGLHEDLTDVLPPDGTSKDGFANNLQLMALSPLQVESYFDIAEKALDRCLVDENSKPVLQNFRMDFGAAINPQPLPDTLVLGANNALLNNADFVVTELRPTKPFEYQPFAMRTKYEFIEGYVGNDTIRGWRKFDSIYHSVFACMRGSPGYPKGLAHQVVSGGLLLRPSIPSGEIFGQSNTYGQRPVSNGALQAYVFEGAINDFPTPDVEKDNVNYLAGIREIGVRSEYTDGRDLPRLLVRSIEFEGPFYDSWPPATHRNILIDSPHKSDPAAYAAEVIRTFTTRAFRRPVAAAEWEPIVAVWKNSFAATGNARQSLKDALLVVLTSPQFLFVIENSSSPAAEDLEAYELASKLSYFLWNAPPDQRLLELAAKGQLHQSLDAEIERMIRDPRFGQFLSEFGSQWLSLDKFDVVAVDAQRFPKLTRDTKTQLRKEPLQFLRHLFEQNLPLRNIVQSDFVVANEVTASYYDLGDRTESGFKFVAIKHEHEQLGGLLTQAGILAGLSDGRESNPIKRGAWLARKMIAEPPDDPPPNVPQLKDDASEKLTLRERLERHRNQKGCVKCHSGIDPWGIPFESFDAGGRWKKTTASEARSTLPDGTQVSDLKGLTSYLAKERIDQVAFSFLKHASCYAVGRSLTYNEVVFLQEQSVSLKANDYRIRELLGFVIKSDAFLKK